MPLPPAGLTTVLLTAAVVVAGLLPVALLGAADRTAVDAATVGAMATLTGAAACVVAAGARRALLVAVLVVTAGWAAATAASGLVAADRTDLDAGGRQAVLSLVALFVALHVVARTTPLPGPVRQAARAASAVVAVGTLVVLTGHAGSPALVALSVAASGVLAWGRHSAVVVVDAALLAVTAGLAVELEPAPRTP